MFDISENLRPFAGFTLWFIPRLDEPHLFDIYEIVENGHIAEEPVGLLDSKEGHCENFPTSRLDEVYEQWTNFQMRPEYAVYSLHRFDEDTYKKLNKENLYDTLIVGIALLRMFKNTKSNPDAAAVSIMKCLEWLHSTDFYRAPASSMYHDCYEGGLLDHTLRVAFNTVELLKADNFKNCVRIQEALLVALVHDWCKIGYYESYLRNVKNEETGVWEKVPSYRRKDALVPLGHGVASMFLARCYFRLSVEESLAIRWHMGEYNVAPNEMNELHQANEKYPLVQLVQFADRLSITSY